MSSARFALTEIAAAGDWGTVEYVIRPSGQIPAKKFIEEELEQIREKGRREPASTAAARFLALFQAMADTGRVPGSKFRSEMEGFFAFSAQVRNLQIRFPCFQDGGRRWLMTHGFIKPGAQQGRGKWPGSEIGRARAIRNEYLQRRRFA